jgi:hypothetical protein
MDPDIEFEFEGVKYTVSSKAFWCNRIELPDRRLLAAEGWSADEPPVPRGLHEIDRRTTKRHFTNSVLAQVKNAYKAEPVYILVSLGDGNCVLEVPSIPAIGTNIAIEEPMIVWKDGFDADFLAGHIYKVAKLLTLVAFPRFGDINWFRLEKIEIK